MASDRSGSAGLNSTRSGRALDPARRSMVEATPSARAPAARRCACGGQAKQDLPLCGRSGGLAAFGAESEVAVGAVAERPARLRRRLAPSKVITSRSPATRPRKTPSSASTVPISRGFKSVARPVRSGRLSRRSRAAGPEEIARAGHATEPRALLSGARSDGGADRAIAARHQHGAEAQSSNHGRSYRPPPSLPIVGCAAARPRDRRPDRRSSEHRTSGSASGSTNHRRVGDAAGDAAGLHARSR